MTKVFIELEFESKSISDKDVYDYLKELIDDECLDWTTNKVLIPTGFPTTNPTENIVTKIQRRAKNERNSCSRTCLPNP